MITNVYKFRKNENRKYRWVFNQEAMMVKQFLVFAKSNPNEILELEKNRIESILNEYADSLKGINVDTTIVNKVKSVITFFEANDIQIENDLVFDAIELDYDEELEQYPPNSDIP